MKDLRAAVVGLLVVLLIAVFWAYWRRPAPGLQRIRSFRVEVNADEHGRRRHISATIPGFLVGKAIRIAAKNLHHARWGTSWDESDVTPEQILAAADRAKPDAPEVLEKDGTRIEVSPEQGPAIRLRLRERHGEETVELVVPRALLEGLSGEKRVRPEDILRQIDRMGPGDLLVVRERDNEVRIRAEGR